MSQTQLSDTDFQLSYLIDVPVEEGLTKSTPEMEAKIGELLKLLSIGDITTPIPSPELWSAVELEFQDLGVNVKTPSLSIGDIKLNFPETSRPLEDFDLSSAISENYPISSPAVPANMQSVMVPQLAKACVEEGIPVIEHRYHSTEEHEKFVKQYGDKTYVSAGVRDIDAELERVSNLIDKGARGVCIDITHGSSFKVLKLCESIKERHPSAEVIIGNICHMTDVIRAARAGADAVKVGMGPGSPCTTRIVTGVGEPQLSAIMMCSLAANFLGIKTIGDGGILDDFLAVAAGSDCNMYGQLFCKTLESKLGRPIKDVKEENGKTFVKYFGEAAYEAQIRRPGARTIGTMPEGDAKWVEVEYSLSEIKDRINKNMANGLDALGLSSIKELREHVREKGFSEILEYADEDSKKLVSEMFSQRDVLTPDVLAETFNIPKRHIEYSYTGSNRNEFALQAIETLLHDVENFGSRSAIEVPGLESNTQLFLESEQNYPTIPTLGLNDLCLTSSYGSKKCASRHNTTVTGKLTENISLDDGIYLPSNIHGTASKDATSQFIKKGFPTILSSDLTTRLQSKVLGRNDSVIPTCSASNSSDAFQLIHAGAKALILEGNDIQESVLLIEKISQVYPNVEVIISGIESFDQALQVIHAGASSIIVDVEKDGATKLTGVNVAARYFNIPVVARAKSITTKEAHTAIALGASLIMEGSIATKFDASVEDEKMPKEILENVYARENASFRSALTLQGCLEIGELHEHTAKNKKVRIIAEGYHAEHNTRVL